MRKHLAIELTVALISTLPCLTVPNLGGNGHIRAVDAMTSNGETANGETAAERLPAYEKMGVDFISMFQDKGG